MSEHSPGPWSACRDGKCSCGQIWSKATDMPVATVIRGDWGDEYVSIRLTDEPSMLRKAEPYMEKTVYGHVPIEAAEANARLIAKAPEMQAEIERLQGLLVLTLGGLSAEDCRFHSDYKQDCGECLPCEIRAALNPEQSHE